MRRRLLYLGALLLVLGGVVAAKSSVGSSSEEEARSAAAPVKPAPPAAGSPAKFTYLAAKRSNSCGLQAADVLSDHDGGRLQGSCCFPMDPQSYREQVLGLKRYSGISQIPADPYDIPVSLAQKLLRYEQRIVLTRRDRTTYHRAMRMSKEGGPCCCPCWRWDAFKGMSKYLIAERRWKARTIARLIDQVEGCGGPSENGPGSA